MPVTLDEFRKMKYNDSNKFYRLTGYKKALGKEPPDIPDDINFDEYEKVGMRIEKELVGLKTKDDLEVKGFVNHFIDRLIGQTPAGTSEKDKRTGVTLDNVKECILNGEFKKEEINHKGEKSIMYKGTKCFVSINPDTGYLIQTNPRKTKKRE
jgi:hypothetical protein